MKHVNCSERRTQTDICGTHTRTLTKAVQIPVQTSKKNTTQQETQEDRTSKLENSFTKNRHKQRQIKPNTDTSSNKYDKQPNSNTMNTNLISTYSLEIT